MKGLRKEYQVINLGLVGMPEVERFEKIREAGFIICEYKYWNEKKERLALVEFLDKSYGSHYTIIDTKVIGLEALGYAIAEVLIPVGQLEPPESNA